MPRLRQPLAPYVKARRAFELWYWSRMVKDCGGSVRLAARVGGTNRTWLYKKLQLLGITATRRKAPVPKCLSPAVNAFVRGRGNPNLYRSWLASRGKERT